MKSIFRLSTEKKKKDFRTKFMAQEANIKNAELIKTQHSSGADLDMFARRGGGVLFLE